MEQIPNIEGKKKRGHLIHNPVFKENYGLALRVAGMYGGLGLTTANVLWIYLHTPILVYTAYHAIAMDYDLGLFAATTYYVVMTISIATSVVNCQWYHRYIEKMVGRVESDFHNYNGTIDPETIEEILKERATMKARKLRVAKYYAWLFVWTFLLNMLGFPIIFRDDDIIEEHEYVHRSLPVTAWYPLPSDVGWAGWLWMLFSEYWIGYVVCATVAGTDIPFLCYTEEGVFQMTKLGLTLRHSVRRAKYLHKKRCTETLKKCEKTQFRACLKECLNHSVKHHHIIIKYFEDMRNLYYYILLVIFMGSTFLLCLSGIVFVSNEVKIREKLQFLIYLIAVLFHTFTWTWYGETISEASVHIGERLYESEWQQYGDLMKNYLLIMDAYSNKPITLSAGGFMISNLNTFGNVSCPELSLFILQCS